MVPKYIHKISAQITRKMEHQEMSVFSATINANNDNKHGNSSYHSLRTHKMLGTVLCVHFFFNPQISQEKCSLSILQKRKLKNREVKYHSGP